MGTTIENIDTKFVEECLISPILWDPELWIRYAHLYRIELFQHHAQIVQAMHQLDNDNKPIDICLLGQYVPIGILTEIQGAEPGMLDGTPATIKHRIGILTDAYQKRQAASISKKVSLGLISATDATSELDQLSQLKESGWIDSNAAAKMAYDRVQQISEQKEGLIGVATGFADLDAVLRGLQPGRLYVVGGRPAMGKTSFALQMAEHAAILKNARVGIVSLEMATEELAIRILTQLSGVPVDHFYDKKATILDWQIWAKSCKKLADSKISIDDNALHSLASIRQSIKQLAKKNNGLDLVIIDYLQLVSSQQRKDNREREVSEISRGLKQLSKEMACPIVVLAQLNRALEQRANKTPQLGDLRESGAIEQDADVVIFVHRPEFYDPDKQEIKGKAMAIIAKNRHGPTKTIGLTWRGELSRFENIAGIWAGGD
jgi:replicative DNA helicase